MRYDVTDASAVRAGNGRGAPALPADVGICRGIAVPEPIVSRYSITVTVSPQYLPDQSAPEIGQFTFAYTVRITNTGNVAAQLISRHWIIDESGGRRIEVKGLGVVGQQPLLQAGEAFEYTSGTPLGSPTGTMRGSYFFVAEDGERFDVPVEEFLLARPNSLH